MDRALDEFERARGRMAGDFRTMITDSEDLLKAAATVSGEGFTAARAKFEEKLRRAKATLADASQPVFDKTRKPPPSRMITCTAIRGPPSASRLQPEC